MKLHFLGTGAADWNWRTYPEGTRGSTMTLVNGTLLIDAGPSLTRNLSLAELDGKQITEVLITHSHSDHFNVEQLEALAQDHPITVHATLQALARLAHPNIRKHAIAIGDVFTACGIQVTATPANHALNDLKEAAFHFLLEENGKRVLYHLDGAWMLSVERQLIGNTPLDAIVWDATSGTTLYDWRMPDHNDLKMISDLRQGMLKMRIITANTRHFFDHIAWSLWPMDAGECQRAAKDHDGILTEDNMVAEI